MSSGVPVRAEREVAGEHGAALPAGQRAFHVRDGEAVQHEFGGCAGHGPSLLSLARRAD